MSRTLIVDTEAEEDLARAKKWYDDKRDGLGVEFLEEVDEAFESIRRMPLVSRILFADLRRMLVRRFPYAVFYRVTEDRITVVAVYHTSRDPHGWQSRA
jgi:toxin ParE1/3/4